MIEDARHVFAVALITLPVVLGPVFIAAPAIGQTAKDKTIRLDPKAGKIAEDKLAIDRDGRIFEWSFRTCPSASSGVAAPTFFVSRNKRAVARLCP